MPKSQDSITTSYATLIRVLCDISEAYLYEGKMDASLNILMVGDQLTAAQEVAPSDAMKFLLQYGKVRIMNYFLANEGYDEMVATVLHAQQAAEKAENEQGKADALQLLGEVYYYQSLNSERHEFARALENFRQALDSRTALHDERGISESLFYIGVVHEHEDEPDDDKAFEYYTRAFHIARNNDYKLEESYATRHLAGMLMAKESKEDRGQALKYALRSLALREEIGFKRYLPPSHNLVGEIYFLQGDVEHALLHQQQAYALAQEMNLPMFCMWSLFAMGEIHQAQKDVSQAKKDFEQAYAIAQEMKIPYGINEASQKLAQLSS